MPRNWHVRFLGEGAAARPSPCPTIAPCLGKNSYASNVRASQSLMIMLKCYSTVVQAQQSIESQAT